MKDNVRPRAFMGGSLGVREEGKTPEFTLQRDKRHLQTVRGLRSRMPTSALRRKMRTMIFSTRREPKVNIARRNNEGN